MVDINREWLRLILPRTRKRRGTALRRLEPKRLVRYFLGVAVVSGSALQLTYAREPNSAVPGSREALQTGRHT